MWVVFDKVFDYPIPGTRSVIAYKAGSRYNVPRAIADVAVASGKARKVRALKRGARDGDRSQS